MFPDAQYLMTASRDDAGMAAILASIRKIIDEEPLQPRHRLVSADPTAGNPLTPLAVPAFDPSAQLTGEQLVEAVADEVLAELLAQPPSAAGEPQQLGRQAPPELAAFVPSAPDEVPPAPHQSFEPEAEPAPDSVTKSGAVDVMLAQLMQGLQRSGEGQSEVATVQAPIEQPTSQEHTVPSSQAEVVPAQAELLEQIAVESVAPVEVTDAAQMDDVPASDISRLALSAAHPEEWTLETATDVLSQSSLEDKVCDMLRPMLREWLDANMPRLIEAALQKELSARGPLLAA